MRRKPAEAPCAGQRNRPHLLIRQTWEQIGAPDDRDALTVIDDVLQGYGTDLRSVLPTFAEYNYRLNPANTNPYDGYVDPDVNDWIDQLELDDETAGDARGGPRPRRISVPVSSGSEATDDARVEWGGATLQEWAVRNGLRTDQHAHIWLGDLYLAYLRSFAREIERKS